MAPSQILPISIFESSYLDIYWIYWIYIGFIKLEPSFITIFFCALEGSRLSHSFVSFLGRDRAPDFEIRFCLKMENKCCSYLTLTNRREKGRAKTIHFSWKVSQHFALEASFAATERYFNFETLHRLDENCTEIKRNLNRSYLLQKEAFPIKDSIHLCTKGMGHTDGTRRNRILGMRKIYLVCKIYALVCTELTAVWTKLISDKLTEKVYKAQAPFPAVKHAKIPIRKLSSQIFFNLPTV